MNSSENTLLNLFPAVPKFLELSVLTILLASATADTFCNPKYTLVSKFVPVEAMVKIKSLVGVTPPNSLPSTLN